MSRVLLYSALSIGSVSMLLFVAGFICWQLGLGILTGMFYLLAGKGMLLMFACLLLQGAVALLIGIWRELIGYFNRQDMAMRRLMSIANQRRNVWQRSQLQRRQLQYWHEFKRRRLLVADNRKQLRELFDATKRELNQIKAQLADEDYRLLSKALRASHKQADAEAMLALRKQILCR